MIAVNLLASELIAASRRRERRRAWSAVLLGQALLVGVSLLVAAQVHTPRVSPSQQIAKLKAQQAEMDQEKSRIAAEMRSLRSRMELSDLVTDHPRWGSLLSLIAKAKGPDAVLERVDVGTRADAAGRDTRTTVPTLRSGYGVSVTGHARTREAVAKIVNQLDATGVFDSVTPVETRATVYGPTGVEVVSFSLSMTLSEGSRAK